MYNDNLLAFTMGAIFAFVNIVTYHHCKHPVIFGTVTTPGCIYDN